MSVLPEAFVKGFEGWTARHQQALKLFVGVDIGGTNTRFALHHSNDDSLPEENVLIYKFKANSTRKILAALEAAAKQLSELGAKEVHGACLAGAGRIFDDGAALDVTNFPGSEQDRHLIKAELPPLLFPPHNTHFVNDLESTCYGIKALNERGELGSYFKTLWPSGSIDKPKDMKTNHYLVLAVGTGLGIAILLSLGTGSRRQNFQVLPMEFGHTLISPIAPSNPGASDEAKLNEYLSDKIYNKEHVPEYEDIVSGRGLVSTYDCVAQGHDDAAKGLSAHEIVEHAFKEPPSQYATKALMLHYKYLMRISKNLSVGLLAKGIFLAGDNQVNNNAFIEQHLEELRAEYLDHPKRDWIEGVELFTQVKPFSLMLHGALHVAREDS